MSNRRKSARERTIQQYRNAGRPGPTVTTDGEGRARRGEGRNNFPYPGQRPGLMRRSVETLHKQAARPRRGYPDHTRDGERRVLLEAMTRDELRGVCKAQNVSGYGKMNKAQLVEAALR